MLASFPRILLALAAAVSLWAETPLESYVRTPDPAYSYHLVRDLPGKGFTVHVLEMTSQSWLTEEQVDRTEWKHWLIVYEPEKLQQQTGLLFISGGSNKGEAPSQFDDGLAAIAAGTNSVVAELKMVPNQPLSFRGDDFGPRVEDELISYNWRRFLDGGDATWLTRLPMTKSAVKAMDTITDFTSKNGTKVDKFFVMGGSKRGWTTWTTAAVDDRVIGISPIVIDMLNLVPSFVHHYQVYGFWAPSVGDYYLEGVMDRFQSKEFEGLAKIVEPYSYRERYTMPKYIVNSAGDQFFLPDSSQFYFDDLPGEKYLRYVPNSDHSLRNTDAIESLSAFYHAVINDRPRPEFSWSVGEDGAFIVRSKDKPAAVKLWTAHNPRHRDFRLESVGPIYQSVDLAPEADGSYVGRVEKPAEGFTAYFVELTYPSGVKAPFKFTTPVRVTPDVYPNGKPQPGKTRVGPQKQ